MISRTCWGSPLRSTPGTPCGSSGSGGYRLRQLLGQPHLLRVRVADRHLADRAVGLQHVHGAPVGEHRDDQAGEPPQDLVELQRAVQCRLRLCDERGALLELLGAQPGDLLLVQQPDALSLDALLLRDVPDDPGHAHRRSRPDPKIGESVSDTSTRLPSLRIRTVRWPDHRLAVGDLAGQEVGLALPVHRGRGGDVPADDLAGRPPVEPLRGRVPGHDRPSQVGGDDRVVGVLDDRGQPADGLLGGLARGDVPHVGGEHGRVVVADARDRDLDRELGAVGLHRRHLGARPDQRPLAGGEVALEPTLVGVAQVRRARSARVRACPPHRSAGSRRSAPPRG